MVVLGLIHDLVENSSQHVEILTDIDWIIVPVANPDGYAYTHEVVSNKYFIYIQRRTLYNQLNFIFILKGSIVAKK